MSNENKKSSTLDQLKNFQDLDNFSELHFDEPELKEFSTANIFEIEKPEPVKRRFGKRSERKASQVKIKNYDETMPEISDKQPASQTITPVTMDNIHEDVEIEPVKEEDLLVAQTTKIDAGDLAGNVGPDVEKTAAMVPVVEENFAVQPVTPTIQTETAPVQEPVQAEPAESKPHEKEPEPADQGQGSTVRMEPVQAPAEKVQAYPFDTDGVEEIFAEEPIFNLTEKKPDYNSEYIDVDEDDEDVYMDKKRFSMANYPRIEEYLMDQSLKGYHFIRQDGKKFYFVKGLPKPFVYDYVYFRKEPTDAQWAALEKEGWRPVTRMAGKGRDAGWIVFRSLKEDDQNRKEIENDEEKLRCFKKQAASYRSTMFLIFICMVCCAVTAWLQFSVYNGYWEILAGCGIIFLICLIAFLIYARYLRSARKRAKLLKSRIRKMKNAAANRDESDQELEYDWQAIPEEKTGKKKKKNKKK